MALKTLCRPLTKGEIEVRVQSVMKDNKGVVLLLYTKAPVCRSLLDEAVGPLNWQNSYEEKKGSLHCKISIWDEEKKQWISREDLGEETQVEAAKGEASDAFKRAAAAWGIGRELSTSPRIMVYADKNGVDITSNGRCWDNFEVEDIIIENGVITALSIINTTKHVRAFYWDNRKKAAIDEAAKEAARNKSEATSVAPNAPEAPTTSEPETEKPKRGRKSKETAEKPAENEAPAAEGVPSVTVDNTTPENSSDELPDPKSAVEKKAEKTEQTLAEKVEEAKITLVDIGKNADKTLGEISDPKELLWLIQNNSAVSVQAKYILADMKAKYEASKQQQ